MRSAVYPLHLAVNFLGMNLDIERLLKISRHVDSDKEVLEMIISNRITHYLGDKDGAAVAIRNFGVLADDILMFIESKERKLTIADRGEVRST